MESPFFFFHTHHVWWKQQKAVLQRLPLFTTLQVLPPSSAEEKFVWISAGAEVIRVPNIRKYIYWVSLKLWNNSMICDKVQFLI